jgi:hypothetical protein
MARLAGQFFSPSRLQLRQSRFRERFDGIDHAGEFVEGIHDPVRASGA